MNLRIASVLMAGLSLAGLAGPAHADARDDVMLDLSRCNAITDNRAWLNCFYGAAQPMRAQLGLAPAPASQTDLVKNAPMTPPPMESSSSEKSGSFLGIGNIFGGGASDNFGTGATRLSAYSFGKDGIFTATLADGEVWRQSPYDDIRAHWTSPAESYTVMVIAETMGSHTLRVKGDHNYRVMRIK